MSEATKQVSNELDQNGECFVSHPQALASRYVTAIEIYLVTHQTYLKGLRNWPIFMLIKVQEMEVSCLKYITAPRKTYCALSHIFQEPIFKSTFNLCALCCCCCCCCCCLGYQSTASIHPAPVLAQPLTWDGPGCIAHAWGQGELGQWPGRSWSTRVPRGGEAGKGEDY